jgi:hypothetical protein
MVTSWVYNMHNRCVLFGLYFWPTSGWVLINLLVPVVCIPFETCCLLFAACAGASVVVHNSKTAHTNVQGLYPILYNTVLWFLVADSGWLEDVLPIVQQL